MIHILVLRIVWSRSVGWVIYDDFNQDMLTRLLLTEREKYLPKQLTTTQVGQQITEPPHSGRGYYQVEFKLIIKSDFLRIIMKTSISQLIIICKQPSLESRMYFSCVLHWYKKCIYVGTSSHIGSIIQSIPGQAYSLGFQYFNISHVNISQFAPNDAQSLAGLWTRPDPA